MVLIRDSTIPSGESLDLPHDWSIEGEFSKDNPATPGGGALPGGIGWYRKAFNIPESSKGKAVFIEFDGVYRNSEVWINGHELGKRPYGYSSFRYELTPYPDVRQQAGMSSRSRSTIRNSQTPAGTPAPGSTESVRLVTTDKVCVDHWGTFITTSDVNEASAVSFGQDQRYATTPLRTNSVTVSDGSDR